MKQVVGLGAGGHARVIIDILRLSGEFDLIGLLDPDPALKGSLVEGVPVLGGDDQLPHLYRRGVTHAFIGVGSIGDTGPRKRLYLLARKLGFQLATAVHPQAVVAASAVLGPGVSVMAAAVINPGAWLGENVVVNTGALVEHGCALHDHVHIATGAHLGGGVQVGTGSHIGIGASVRQGIRIGCNSIVGVGAAVVDNVPDNVVVVGVPARFLRLATAESVEGVASNV